MIELNHTGMLEIYNHQYLWDTRTDPRVYDAFVDIWDREDLWVTIDRANLNLPKKVKGNPNGFIHWDVDTTLRPLPIGVQGVLSLARQDDRGRRLPVRARTVLGFRRMGADAAGRPRPDASRHDGPRHRQRRRWSRVTC